METKKIYRCKYCGKEFTNSAAIGGHTFSCKENPNYVQNMKRSSIQFHKHNEERREVSNYGVCKLCGKPLNSSGKKFCNNSCAAKFNNKVRREHGYTTKGKTKIVTCKECGKEFETSIHSVPDTYICDCCRKNLDFIIQEDKKKNVENPNKSTGSTYIKTYVCKCIVCGKYFNSRNRTSSHCSAKCSNNDPQVKEKLRKKQQELIEQGKHKGWISRNIRSYPEKFWMNVLANNNISFEQEVYIKEYQYFLDFLIETPQGKIDLEIDGSQHNKQDAKYKDKIRDERLTNMGYIIYRIPWNEINTGFGKELMKKKIDDFLKFIATE